ncbi:hypothetical protein [Clostridium senegalense]|uniref:Uncharacterized protein n=1 Tax=Clostridium senegalense TaxID=1465809 RepID=A0A6M0H4N9_9CLOT|nr:hypothetical protein [Clostridium senegalense]NEU05204.1 hypothetical protein [Clostridium senegalense]
MSSSIKEIIIKFIFVFLFLCIIGYFIKWLEINFNKALAISLGIGLVDFVTYTIKNSRNKTNF